MYIASGVTVWVNMSAKIHDIAELRQRTGIFRGRQHAGQVLGDMLESWRGSDAIVMGIPSGGVPVAAECARRLELPLDVAVVSKILLPWNTESGFGAVGFDGSVWINQKYVEYFGLDQTAIATQTESAQRKVSRRVQRFRGDLPWPDLDRHPVILVDDGLAAGSTMRVAAESLCRSGARQIIVAVPTAHYDSFSRIVDLVDEIYCANIRQGVQYSVAAAYESWSDVEEDDS